jgi:prophage regulatory protein
MRATRQKFKFLEIVMIHRKNEDERKQLAKSVVLPAMDKQTIQRAEDDKRIIRIKKLSELTGLSISAIYAKLDPKSESHDPTFPCPVRLGAKAVGWHYGEVIAWIESRPYTRANLAANDRRAA